MTILLTCLVSGAPLQSESMGIFFLLGVDYARGGAAKQRADFVHAGPRSTRKLH